MHHPGSAVSTSTQTCGVTAQLHTSPPHAMPLPTQSWSTVQAIPTLSGSVAPMLPDGATLPPPLKLLMRAILFAESSVNQMFLSGPRAMPSGSLSAVGTAYSAMAPDVVTRPTALGAPASVYHRLPSGPAVMLPGLLPEGTGNSVMLPEGVMRPILWPSCSENHRLPSAPFAIPPELLAAVGMANSVMVQVGVMRPIRLPEGAASVNQRLPSGPSAIAVGPLAAVGRGNSLKSLPEGATRPTLLATGSVNHKFPSGPRVIPDVSSPFGAPNSVYEPLGVMRPIPCCLVYQTLPSGPAVMATGPVFVVDVSNRPNWLPSGVTLPMALGAVLWCVNQTLPSGPAVMAPGSLAVGIRNSVNVRLGPTPAIAGAAPEALTPELPAPPELLAIAPELDTAPLEPVAPVTASVPVPEEPVAAPENEPLAEGEPLCDGEPSAEDRPEAVPSALSTPEVPTFAGGADPLSHADPERLVTAAKRAMRAFMPIGQWSQNTEAIK